MQLSESPASERSSSGMPPNDWENSDVPDASTEHEYEEESSMDDQLSDIEGRGP